MHKSLQRVPMDRGNLLVRRHSTTIKLSQQSTAVHIMSGNSTAALHQVCPMACDVYTWRPFLDSDEERRQAGC